MYVPGWLALYVAVALVACPVYILWLKTRGKRGE